MLQQLLQSGIIATERVIRCMAELDGILEVLNCGSGDYSCLKLHCMSSRLNAAKQHASRLAVPTCWLNTNEW